MTGGRNGRRKHCAPTFTVTRLADTHINPLLAATVEAIFNALVAVTTVVGRDGRRVKATSIPTLQRILKDRGSPRIEYGAGF